MSAEKSKLRGYRRGIPYRSGNVKEEQFVNEFKYKGVNFNNDEYSESEKRSYLNYTYDALKDLATILSVPVEILSLINVEGEKPYLVFGISDKSYKNFVLNKSGDVVKNWVKYLDKFMGYELGLEGGLCNNVTSDMSDAYSQNLRPVLQVLKFKENIIDKDSLTSERLESFRSRILELLEKMPIKEKVDFNLIAEIEDTRTRFLKELSEDRLNDMISTFEKNDLDLSGIKEELKDLFVLARNEKEDLFERNRNNDLIHTDFYKEVIKIEDTNLELFSRAVNFYIDTKLKELGCYNNFLVNQGELLVTPINPEESPVFLEAIERYFNMVLPLIVDKVVVPEIEVVEPVENNSSIQDIDSNIEKVLAEDKGKFKLTLFKKLAKEAGLKVNQSKTDKIANSNIYLIDFENSYIKYMKPHIFNNPMESGHCINIYCGPTGDTKQGYWWDNELDYVDLIRFLCEIEENAKQAIVKEVEDKIKFKLSGFKDACIKVGLKADKSETPIVNNRYVITFKNGYITYVYAPIYLRTDEKEQSIKIKTLREEIYHTWKGKLVYKDLVTQMVNIESQGKKVLEEEKLELLKVKEKLEKEKKELINKVDATKKEYDKYISKQKEELRSILDCSNLRDTKELRDKLNRYLVLKQYRLNYNPQFNNVMSILVNNIYEKDNLEFVVEPTVIPEKKLKGNAKSWNLVSSNHLQVQRRADNKKQLEGLIEGFVESKLVGRNYSKVQKQMFSETLTFMLCKICNLDVRTYCNSPLFERFLRSGDENVSSYLSKSFKLFDSLLVYFV